MPSKEESRARYKYPFPSPYYQRPPRGVFLLLAHFPFPPSFLEGPIWCLSVAPSPPPSLI